MFGKKIFMRSPVFSVIHAIYDYFLLTHWCTKRLVQYSYKRLVILNLIYHSLQLYGTQTLSIIYFTCTSELGIVCITMLKINFF